MFQVMLPRRLLEGSECVVGDDGGDVAMMMMLIGLLLMARIVL